MKGAKPNIKIDKKSAKAAAENIFYPLLSFAIMLAIWAIASKIKGNEFVLPMPDVVLGRFFKLGSSAGFWASVGATLLRTLICFVISFLLALCAAAIGGIFTPFHKVMSPIVTVLRAAPTVAVILIMYAFLRSDTMAVVVGFLIAFPILYSSFYTAISGVDRDLLEMAKVYKVRTVDRILQIYLPSIANTLFDAGKSTLSLALKVVVAAEILTNVTVSIGGSVQVAYASFEVDYLLAWTLVAIVFSFVLEGAVALLKKLWEVTR